MTVRKTYVYDKRIDKIVEKRSRDNILLMPMPSPPVPEWWANYLRMMADTYDIMAGKEPQSAAPKSRGADF